MATLIASKGCKIENTLTSSKNRKSISYHSKYLKTTKNHCSKYQHCHFSWKTRNITLCWEQAARLYHRETSWENDWWH